MTWFALLSPSLWCACLRTPGLFTCTYVYTSHPSLSYSQTCLCTITYHADPALTYLSFLLTDSFCKEHTYGHILFPFTSTIPLPLLSPSNTFLFTYSEFPPPLPDYHSRRPPALLLLHSHTTSDWFPHDQHVSPRINSFPLPIDYPATSVIDLTGLPLLPSLTSLPIGLDLPPAHSLIQYIKWPACIYVP